MAALESRIERRRLLERGYGAMAAHRFERAYTFFFRVAVLTAEPLAYQRAADALSRVGRHDQAASFYEAAAEGREQEGQKAQARALRVLARQHRRLFLRAS